MNKYLRLPLIIIAALWTTLALSDQMQSPLKIGNGTTSSVQMIFNQGHTPNSQISVDAAGDITVAPASGGIVASGSQIQAPVGSAGSPSYSFHGSNTTGLYLSGSSDIAITASGSPVLDVNTSGAIVRSGFQFLGPDGGGGDPSYSFSNSINSGMYLKSVGVVSIDGGGNNTIDISSTTATVNGALSVTGGETISSGGLSVTGATTLNSTGGNVPHNCDIETHTNSSVSTTSTVTCAAGKIATGGGCTPGGANTLTSTFPLTVTNPVDSWNCVYTNAQANQVAYAVCCSY